MNATRKVRKPFPWHLVVFIAPALIIYVIVMVIPLLDSLTLSFFTEDPNNARNTIFVGIQNYKYLFTDKYYAPIFWGAFKNNIVFFLIHMLVQNPIGLLLASVLCKGGKIRNFFRTVLFIPTILSFVLVGFVWKLILSPVWGVSKTILNIFGLGGLFRPWLGLEETALITCSLISVWQYIGTPMILFYTALIAIPDELMEAAYVDGANAWQIFWRVKFPLILPTVGLVAMMTFVGNFNAFDLIYTMQGALAGPNLSTDIMGTLFYRTFFGQQQQMPNQTLGATIAAMQFIIILMGVVIYMIWQKRTTTYEY